MYIRLELLQALDAQLKTISSDNGYATNVGQRVTYWDTYEHDYNGPPAITFRDQETQYERVNQKYVNFFTVEIEAIAYTTQADKLATSVNLLEDIKRAIIDSHWHNKIIAVRPVADSKEIVASGRQVISVVLSVTIEYRD